ncbi:MAG TPA: group 1 truncated hemoglobin [Burkholderiaceae bacterium]|jgi:hemoglobin
MKLRQWLLATVFAAHAAASFAQTAPPTDDALYRQLGGQPGLVKLTDDFMTRLLADPRMNPFFKDVDQKVFKSQLADQLCEVSGGPCTFKGKDMKKVHEGQDITKSNFNALVEVLQQSLDAQGIPFTAQNKLLAKLAPMHREIVNAP